MSIDKKVVSLAEAFREARADDKELRRLEEFLMRMREAGIASQRRYDLPQLDTVGRHLVAQSEDHLAS